MPTAMVVKSAKGNNSYKKKWKPQCSDKKENHYSQKKSFPFKSYKCHKIGHKVANWYEVIDRKSQRKASTKNETCWIITPHQERALKAEQCYATNRWYLDSECTSDMSHYEKLFVD